MSEKGVHIESGNSTIIATLVVGEDGSSTAVDELEIELPINTHVYFELPTEEDVPKAQEEPPKTATPLPQQPLPSRWSAVKKKMIDNALPLGFSIALIVALSYPAPGRTLASYSYFGIYLMQAINNINVFFISGITLNVNALTEVRQHWKAVLFGILAILFVTPLLGFVFYNIPLEPREFSLGLAIFCCVPTTLGVGVALTTAAGGNNSVALFLTVVTNICGILTMPYMLQFILLTGGARASTELKFDPATVFAKLIFTVLIPSLLGFLTNKYIATARAFVNRHRVELSLFSTSNLVCIVWQTLSSASELLLKQSAKDLVSVVALSASLHILLLAILMLITSPIGFLPLPIKERVAVTIMAAQKSAPVAVTLISYVSHNTSQQGLLSIPALIGQLCQIFIGSALISHFRKMIRSEKEGSAGAGGEVKEEKKAGG